METNKELAEKTLANLINFWETSARAADRTLQLAENSSNLMFSNLREAFGLQTQMIKDGLTAKKIEDLSEQTKQNLHELQTRFSAVQQSWANLGVEYIRSMVKDLENQKTQVISEAEEIKISLQSHFPQGANAFAQTIDTWMEMATRSFDQATTQGQRINDLSKILVEINAKPKSKGNGARA